MFYWINYFFMNTRSFPSFEVSTFWIRHKLNYRQLLKEYGQFFFSFNFYNLHIILTYIRNSSDWCRLTNSMQTLRAKSLSCSSLQIICWKNSHFLSSNMTYVKLFAIVQLILVIILQIELSHWILNWELQ